MGEKKELDTERQLEDKEREDLLEKEYFVNFSLA